LDTDINQLVGKSVGMWNTVIADLGETTDIDL
jgi:hypothetical protein